MQIIERGRGRPVIVVPGIQGRWEWHQAAIDALARRYRVITFSLGDEPSARYAGGLRPGIDGFADQVERAADSLGLERFAVCGISFGGLVALRYAARTPGRVTALAMVSAPGPQWHLKARHQSYAQRPLLFGPVFAVEALRRVVVEVAATFDSRREQLRFLASHGAVLLKAPASARRMAVRAAAIQGHDRLADCTVIACPTLIMHGEPALDHVVNAGGTGEYVAAIAGASRITLERTGHLGLATRPGDFADALDRFLTGIRQGSHDSAA